LVRDNVKIYKPARMGNGDEILGVEEILKKWEITDPKQVIDILGLWGDASDNIPGVPGVGEKTAKKLIQEYGSMEVILENIDKLKGKMQENFRNFTEQAKVSKWLATIDTQVPIALDLEALKMEPVNEPALREVFWENLVDLPRLPQIVVSETHRRVAAGVLICLAIPSPRHRPRKQNHNRPIKLRCLIRYWRIQNRYRKKRLRCIKPLKMWRMNIALRIPKNHYWHCLKN
jgi:5'-3' exonuclease